MLWCSHIKLQREALRKRTSCFYSFSTPSLEIELFILYNVYVNAHSNISKVGTAAQYRNINITGGTV